MFISARTTSELRTPKSFTAHNWSILEGAQLGLGLEDLILVLCFSMMNQLFHANI